MCMGYNHQPMKTSRVLFDPTMAKSLPTSLALGPLLLTVAGKHGEHTSVPTPHTLPEQSRDWDTQAAKGLRTERRWGSRNIE